MSKRPPNHPAYLQWLRGRVGFLVELRRTGVEDIGPIATQLKESAAEMGYEEIAAAAGAIRRLVDVDPQAIDAAIEILRRIVNRAARPVRRHVAA